MTAFKKMLLQSAESGSLHQTNSEKPGKKHTKAVSAKQVNIAIKEGAKQKVTSTRKPLIRPTTVTIYGKRRKTKWLRLP